MLKKTALLAFILLAPFFNAAASETDQYTGREIPLKDANVEVNRRFNESIAKVVRNWKGPRNDFLLAKRVRWTVEGYLYYNRFDQYIRSNPRVERVNNWRHSIYAGVPAYKTIINIAGAVSETVSVSGYRFGVDKFSHMLSIGWLYYKKYVKCGEACAIDYGIYTEAGPLGWIPTGVYSNADIVADHEGHLFFRGLYEDGVVRGKSAIVRWDGNVPVIQRRFDIADHVNEYWDEAINTNQFRKGLLKPVRKRLLQLCSRYSRAPGIYGISRERDIELRERYEPLRLWNNTEYRLANICGN